MNIKCVMFHYGVVSHAFLTLLRPFLSWHGKCASTHLLSSFWSSNHTELRSRFSSSVSKRKAFSIAEQLASGNKCSQGVKNCDFVSAVVSVLSRL